jgi:hypothetical protein
VYHLLYLLLNEVVDVGAQQIRLLFVENAAVAPLFYYILRKEHHENVEVFEVYPLNSASKRLKELLHRSTY